ncbi:MAG: DNA recombination protein RmuC, partial [Deltaproteobacteria bacterium]|nr:DNA recombination protein RmuC [Deltaproteobacteria bacterium]
MDGLSIIIGLCLGLVIGGAAVWLISRATQQQASADMKTEMARLETTLELERKQTAEKLALLDQAKDQMADAFAALSSEALKSSNQSFLELAKATLEKYQAEAKGDLEQRQKAVEHLVSPLRESLD